MMVEIVFKSTRMDAQGRIFLPSLLRRRTGLKAGAVEFELQKDGSAVIRNVRSKKK